MDEQGLEELKARHAKQIEELEARLDLEARSDELIHKRHLDKLTELWRDALTPTSTAEALGLTPSEFVARYGSDRIIAFVANYMGKGTGTRAAALAGYNGSKAYQCQVAAMLLTMPMVVAAINEKVLAGLKGPVLSLNDIMCKLSQEAMFAETSKDRRAALETLAKMQGAFEPKKDVGALSFEDLPAELELAAARRKKK